MSWSKRDPCRVCGGTIFYDFPLERRDQTFVERLIICRDCRIVYSPLPPAPPPGPRFAHRTEPMPPSPFE